MPDGLEEPQPIPLHEIARRGGVYPPEAYEFVTSGLQYTVSKIHNLDDKAEADSDDDSDGKSDADSEPKPDQTRHISGRQLCLGLREYAWHRWGMMANTVLRRWNITCTFDFGRMVYEMVECGILRTTQGDSVEDFRRVYDFDSALELEYRIENKP